MTSLLFSVMSYHVNRMTTRVITLWRVDVTTRVITLWRVDVTSFDNVCVNTAFLFEIMIILKAIKCHFKGSYDKQNLTLVVISFENHETRRKLVS